MTVLITLTLAGADTGPFSLYSDIDGFLAPFETGVLKSALVSGYTSVVVPDGSTVIRVQSTSSCTNYVDFPISGITTTTTTSTSTSTTTTTTSITPLSCQCYAAENTTEAPIDCTYTPCGGEETIVSVPAGNKITMCVQGGTSPFGSGLTITNCGGPCTFDSDCTTCGSPLGTQYQLYGYAESKGEACGQTGTYTTLSEVSKWAVAIYPTAVTLFYSTNSPLSDPYINPSIPTGNFILFVRSSDSPPVFYVGEYNNTTGAITNVSACPV